MARRTIRLSLRQLPWLALLATTMAFTSGTVARACGPETDCALGGRSYRVVVPEKPMQGAIVFVHGYRGKAAQVMQNNALTELSEELGVVFAAAQAAGPEWNIPGMPSIDAREGVDELAYFDALAADLQARFGIPADRVMVAGFSSGAMMVWHLACYRAGSFAGYVPMSGTFWEPIPRSCPGAAATLIHYHGRQDPVVPLAGRQIKDGHQGDVFAAMAMMARNGGYHPVAVSPEEGLDCTRQQDAAGHRLELCLFEGKHEFRVENIRRAWRIVSGRG